MEKIWFTGNKGATAKCPRCDAPQEDKAHIITCQQDEANLKWTESLKSLERLMQLEQSNPQLTALLINGLQTWRNGEDPPQDSTLAQQQASIGWSHVLDGWLTVEWRVQQDAYWAQWKRRKPSRRWITELIKKLWNIAWDMWAHRNRVLHNSESYRDDILDSKINNQIRALYDGGLQMVPRDAFSMFRTPLKVLLSKPLGYKEQWVASVQAAMRRKRYHDHGAYLSEQQGMR